MEKKFANGFINWFETSVEITAGLLHALNSNRIELDGRGELWELIEEYTDEFENDHEGVEWGDSGEFESWFDTLEDFIEEKIQILEQ